MKQDIKLAAEAPKTPEEDLLARKAGATAEIEQILHKYGVVLVPTLLVEDVNSFKKSFGKHEEKGKIIL